MAGNFLSPLAQKMVDILLIIALIQFWFRRVFFGTQVLPKNMGAYVDDQNWQDCAYRSRWFCQNAHLTSPLRSFRRSDQNAYMERQIWTSDERVMTSGRFDPNPDRSDWLARAVRPVRTAQSELGVVI